MYPEVVNVRVADIRPEHNDLKEWMDEPGHLYIGRRGVVFIIDKATRQKKRYPEQSSPYANPYSLKKYTRQECLALYREHLSANPLTIAQKEQILNATKLGCWCAPEPCHGDILIEFASK